jgi:uncharacterized protein YjiS (DUF1127 family)
MQFLHSGIAATNVVQPQHMPILALTVPDGADAELEPEANDMAYLTQTRAADHGFRARIATLFAQYGERVERYRLYRNTVRELEQLSGRELADLGIHSSQIDAIAYEAAYGK